MTVPLALDASVWFFAGQVDDSETVRHVPIHSTPFRVGRRTDVSLSLACQSVSKEHAEIFEKNDELWVRDLQSTNGTYLNGRRITAESVLCEGDLVQFATVVFRVGREGTNADVRTIHENACDWALAMTQFDRLLNDGAVVPFYQPIVTVAERKPIGFEVLGRSRLFGLMNPKDMFAAASRLNLQAELSRVFRRQGVVTAQKLPSGANLFVNTHPVELVETGLVDSLREIRQISSSQPITLEIHEAAVTNPASIRALRDVLNDLDMSLAYDDFGAGQARLIELIEVRPDYLKFDMELVQGIHLAPASRQQLVASLVRMAADLGIVPLAEGIECEGECDACRQMGFQLGQGFYFGKPAPVSRCVAEAETLVILE